MLYQKMKDSPVIFKESEIRSTQKDAFVDRVRLKDIQRLFLDNEGDIIKNYFINVNCPACGKAKNPKEFIKEKFIFRRCQRCNTVYVSPRPKSDKLLEYYKYAKSIELFTKDILQKTCAARKERIFMPRAKKLISYIHALGIPRRLLVEIGGGNGMFLEVMKETRAGFKKYLNIEPSPEGAKLTKKRGFDIINNFIEVVEGLQADCICAFELIEHIFDPIVFCKKVKELLSEKGIFIMTTPNIEGLDFILLGKDSDNISAPNHLNYFNTSSIRTLLRKTGFKVISIETPGVLDVDIVANKLKKGYRIKDRFISFLLTQPELTLADFQVFLQQHNLSSNMLVIATKQ